MSTETQRVSRLILTGFMGAGKSTVGAILAQELGWRFVDLDRAIEASSQRTVVEVFRDFGEAEFRTRERQALHQLSSEEHIVLALGGGTIDDESNRMRLIQSPGNCLVFLDGPLSELLARCSVEGKTRPLLSSTESPEARHHRRLPHYRAAHLTVNTTGLAPREVAGRVLKMVSQQWLIEARKR
jgi:shikimate kinase